MSSVSFLRLFDGNRLAYGGDEGKAVRCTEQQWTAAVMDHYSGKGAAIGVYPLVHDLSVQARNPWVVKWGCVDLDIKSEGHEKFDYDTEDLAHVAALNLQKVLAAFGVSSWIERTRSHGRHVWVFASAWVTAVDMRQALLVATDIAGVSQREVNPKSDGSNLGTDQLGNYVRLPYHGERVILVDSLPINKVTFTTMAYSQRAAAETFERMTALYREPPPPVEWEAPAELNGNIPKVVKHVIENGPHDGDRSNGLVYIAHECRKADLSPQQTLEVLMVADDAWGKYTGRRDREQRLQEIVERAWR